MTQIARERFPDLFPGEESLAAMASRVLVFTPRTSQQLLQTLQASAAHSAVHSAVYSAAHSAVHLYEQALFKRLRRCGAA